MLPKEAGSGSQERSEAGGAFGRPCPPFALHSLRGKKRELERCLHCESTHSPACLTSACSRRPGFGQLIRRKATGFSLKEAFLPPVFVAPFGTQNGAKRGTINAMSRRKLGSRPQHLSAIQGKEGQGCVDPLKL